MHVRSEGHDQHTTGANQSFICVLKKSSLNIRPTRRVEKYIFREDFFVKSSLRSSFRSASMVIWTISPTTILPLQARHSNSSYSCVDINIKRGAAWQMCTRVPAQYQSEFVIWSALPVMRNSSFLIRVYLSLMRNGPFLIWSEPPPNRSGPFLIWVSLSLMRNSQFLIWSERPRMFLIWVGLPLIRNRQLLIRSPLSLIRDRLFLIRVCLPIMWKSLLLIGFGFSPIRQSQLPSGPRKG